MIIILHSLSGNSSICVIPESGADTYFFSLDCVLLLLLFYLVIFKIKINDFKVYLSLALHACTVLCHHH